jgi:hypothetical protein
MKNNGYSDARLKKRERKKKREMNKVVYVFLQSCFQVLKRDMFSKSIVELS